MRLDGRCLIRSRIRASERCYGWRLRPKIALDGMSPKQRHGTTGMRLPMHQAKILAGLRRGHRTNLCTTRTRPRRDLSVTWPSQGTFPRSHPSARGPALTTFWPSHRVDRLGSLVVDGELDEIVVGIAEVRAGRHAARARSGPSLWCHAVRVVVTSRPRFGLLVRENVDGHLRYRETVEFSMLEQRGRRGSPGARRCSHRAWSPTNSG